MILKGVGEPTPTGDEMKLTQFATAPDGRLVYRNSGRVVRGNVNYSSNRDTLGRGYTVIKNRVYKNGRLQGYVGKPNATQKKRIDKLAKTREKRAIKNAIDYGGFDYTARGGWDSVALGKRTLSNYQTGINTYFDGGAKIFMSYQETRQMNYASALNQGVNANIISIEDANDLWEKYLNADSDDMRSALWDDLNKRFDEMGYEIDSPPLFDEMGRMLGLDIDFTTL